MFSLLLGFSHLPSGLYPSYLHLNHLEPPSSGSPLLSQLGQPSIFDTQKDGFYLPAPGTLHAHTPSSRTPSSHSSGGAAKGSSREGTGKDRSGRGGDPPPLFGKKDPRAREEVPMPRGVVDLTQEVRAEGRQDRGSSRLAERLSPFLAEAKAKGALQPSALSLCIGVVDAGLVAELSRGGAKEVARQEENARLLRRAEALLPAARPCGSLLPPPPPLPTKGPPAPPSSTPAGVYTVFREQN